MKKDLSNRDDIIELINCFYEKVKKDILIGPFFTEVVYINWEKHMPIMYDFWESVLFQKNTYSRNAMQVHKQLHEKKPIQKEHFERWIKLFTETIDSLYCGAVTEIAKQRARSIAMLIQLKNT